MFHSYVLPPYTRIFSENQLFKPYKGVICAGYLILVKGLTSEEAKMIVRRNRPGSLQTRSQLQAVDDFEIYLAHRRKWPDQESLYELWKLQRPTTTKRDRM